MRALLNGFCDIGVFATRAIAFDSVMSIFVVHSVSLTTQGQVTPKRIKKANKTVVATAGNVLLSLRSGSRSPRRATP